MGSTDSALPWVYLGAGVFLKKLLVTGASGLIGSEVCAYFSARGFRVDGVDNNLRATLFSTAEESEHADVQGQLERELENYTHHNLDIRDAAALKSLFEALRPDAIVHAAAQPSHELSARIPAVDFEINAVGTLNLLEAAREFCRESPFVFLSSNKVYGDSPNLLALCEKETRYVFADPKYASGIDENFKVDQSLHTPFGASKLSADILVQEFGRYYGMPTVCLRGGCLTGPGQVGVSEHGFLNYLIKANIAGLPYVIHGYKGKQLRDNIHAFDIARFIDLFISSPKCAAVYNVGGGLENSCSVIEAIEKIESISEIRMNCDYSDTPRKGDHICYYSDLGKLKADYPQWSITKSLDTIFSEICLSWHHRIRQAKLHQAETASRSISSAQII